MKINTTFEIKLKKIFGDNGYILDFSDRTFAQFFEDNYKIDICDEKYSRAYGGSKFKRLKGFIEAEDLTTATRVLQDLWDHGVHIKKFNPKQQGEFIDLLDYLNKSHGESDTNGLTSSSRNLFVQAKKLQLDNIKNALEKAIERCESDPSGAITAACTILESVYHSIISALSLEPPKRMSLDSLHKLVIPKLNMNKLSDEKYNDNFHKIMNGIDNLQQGIGSLRTHVGDAHGKPPVFYAASQETAEFMINITSALCLLLIKRFKNEYPSKTLYERSNN